MKLENINSPDYETVFGDDYEIPVEKNPQPGDRNTHTIVNLPIDKTNEKVCETINIFNYLYSIGIYVKRWRAVYSDPVVSPPVSTNRSNASAGSSAAF